MPDFDTAFAAASQLSVAQRWELIDALWDTVPEGQLPPLSDAWLAEIQRRSAELDALADAKFLWEDVRAAAIRRLGVSSEQGISERGE